MPSRTPRLFLSLPEIREQVNARCYAHAAGVPLLLSVTVHFRQSPDFDPAHPMRFIGRLLDKMTRWIKGQKYADGTPMRAAFVWVRENAPKKHDHLHLLLHLPKHLWGAFEDSLHRAGRFRDGEGTDTAIHLNGGGGYRGAPRYDQLGMQTRRMQAGAQRYTLKGACPRATVPTPRGRVKVMDALGIRPVASLPVLGKRSGTSFTIGPKARAAAGWRELRTLDELHDALHPLRHVPRETRKSPRAYERPRLQPQQAAPIASPASVFDPFADADDLGRDFFRNT